MGWLVVEIVRHYLRQREQRAAHTVSMGRCQAVSRKKLPSRFTRRRTFRVVVVAEVFDDGGVLFGVNSSLLNQTCSGFPLANAVDLQHRRVRTFPSIFFRTFSLEKGIKSASVKSGQEDYITSAHDLMSVFPREPFGALHQDWRPPGPRQD
jgi:hypothetical protein